MTVWSSCFLQMCAFYMVNVSSSPTPDKCFAAGLLKALQATIDNRTSYKALRNTECDRVVRHTACHTSTAAGNSMRSC